MRIIRAVATVGGYTGISRIFGLVREILMSHIIGASGITDAFLVAFKFPNFFRRLFAEGAFNAAFVPVFAEKLAQEGPDSAQQIAEEVLIVLFSALLILVIGVVVFAPSILHILAPGFTTTPERLEMAVTFIRITFPYILFISLAALYAGVLNSLDKFAAAAAAPILLNIIMIAALLSHESLFLSPGIALSIAVFVSGIAQLTWLTLACRRAGISLRIRLPHLTPNVRKVMKLMLPGAIGAGVMNINIFLDMILASFLPQGSISYLHYADRLNQLPLAVFGIAMGTALLPSLSREIRTGSLDRAMRNQNIAVELSFQLTLPASIGLILLSHPIISLIYGLNAHDTSATASALAVFAIGIPAYVLGKIFSTSFFARQDTATPVKVATMSIVCNFLMNLALMGPLAHVGLALSTAIAAWINAGILYLLLYKREHFVPTPTLPLSIVKTVSACAGMGILLYVTTFFEQMDSLLSRIAFLLSQIFAGIAVFAVIGRILGAFDLTQFRQAFRRS